LTIKIDGVRYKI